MGIRDHLLPRPPLRLPRRTIRLRLTILYAGLFLVSGVGLLAITYGLVSNQESLLGTKPDGSTIAISGGEEAGEGPATGTTTQLQEQFQEQLRDGAGPSRSKTSQQVQAQAVSDRALLERQHDAEMRRFLEQSGIALALMGAASILLGWLVAGRVLRPVRTLNERAREISATNLHRRLALAGPEDELTQLADTFDDLLGRLEASFQAQRQFVANASHELRTPLTRSRTVAEVALADPDATVDSLRASHQRVLVAGEQQERMIEALLTLARSERGLDQHEPFDLADVTDCVVASRRPEAERRRLHLQATLEPAEASGDPRLAERLVANLVDNALRHNQPQGRVDVTTASKAGRAVVSVANSGPLVPPDEVERLFQPFQRLGADRTDHGTGIGLGLSIVKAIAVAHGASLTAGAQPDGGLDIEVSFPSVDAVDGRADDTSRDPTRRKRALLRRRPEAPDSDDLPSEEGTVR
jgi:signal transduction histidine kinase